MNEWNDGRGPVNTGEYRNTQDYSQEQGPNMGYGQGGYGQAGQQEIYGSNPNMYYGQKPPKRGGNKGAVIAAVIGAVIILAIIGLTVWYFVIRDSSNVKTVGDYYVTGCKEALKVRESEDEDSKVLTKLNNGEKVSLVEKTGDSWKIYIEAEDVIGYLDYHYLTNDRDAVTDPVTRYVAVDGDDELTILNTSEGDGTSVGVLERGDEVTVLAQPDGDYAYIYAPEASAYGYVERNELAEDQPQPEEGTDGNDKQVASVSGGNGDLIGPGGAPANNIGIYYVNVQKGYLALRNAKAFDSSNEIGKMYNGDYVYALRNDGEYWYVYSPFLGSYGYTNASYLVSSYSGVKTYRSSVYYASVDSGYLALRNAPAYDSSNEIGKIANGQEVDLIDSSLGTYWYVYVPALGRYGYVNSDYLR